ncbi:MAG: SurA N-terminal domain-containing protein [Thermoguttaceae bacterium]
MASPFSIFRKHQKVMIAVLGVLAMFAFVFLSMIQDWVGTRGGAVSNPVVVKTTRYGDLTAREVEGLSQRRMSVIRFLQQVRQAAGSTGSTGNVAGMYLRRIGDASRERVVDTWLRAKHAERLGIVISDNAVNDFVREITENAENKGVSTFQLEQILENIGITQVQLFDVLRHELLAMRAGQLFRISLGGTTPAQRWDYFKRLKRMATIEVVPVRVADFLENVEEEPSEETLRAFFEEHRETYANPNFPEPGFRVPHRIAVNYLKADNEKLTSPDIVTDEEVRAAYEERKELYDSLPQSSIFSPLLTEDEPTEDEPTEDEPTEDEPTEDEPAEGEATEGEPTEGEPVEEPPATESDNEPATVPTDDAPAEDDSADAAAETEETTEDAPTEEEGDTSEDTSATSPASPFLLASFLQEEEETDEQGMAEENESTDVPAESTDDPAVEDVAPASETKEPAVVGPKLPLFEPRPEPPPGPTVEQPEEEPADDDDIVSTSIGRMIRQNLAYQRSQTVMSDLQDRIMAYFRKRRSHTINAPDGEVAEADLAALDAAFVKEIRAAGEQSGLIWGESPDPDAGVGPIMSGFEAQDFEIGRTFIRFAEGGSPFVQYAFEANRQLYEAEVSVDRQGNRYLFWKVEDSKERIPDFDEEGVRDEVRRVWKMQKARRLATEAAEALAAKARKDSLRSLSDSIGSEPNVEVSKTDPFSWLTRGNVPATTSPRPQLRRTKLEPIVELAGSDFMRTVFGLSKGGIAVAMNLPQEIAYVVRVSEINPPERALWIQFEVDGYDTYSDVGRQEQIATFLAWQESLKTEVGFEWAEQPDQEPIE